MSAASIIILIFSLGMISCAHKTEAPAPTNLATAQGVPMTETQGPIIMTRTFNAPVAKVWPALTEEKLIKKWWSPKRFTAPVVKNDFRVGGKFLFAMKSPDGNVSYNSGVYTDIIQFKKIVSNMEFSDKDGNIVSASSLGLPGQWTETIIVTMELSEAGGKTTLTVTEHGIPKEMAHFGKLGWEQQFDKLEKVLK